MVATLFILGFVADVCDDGVVALFVDWLVILVVHCVLLLDC